MGFAETEADSLPMNANSLVGSVMENFCGSHYLLHMSVVETSSQKVMIDKAFSVFKCLRLAIMSYHAHQLLKKMWGAVPGPRVHDLSYTWGRRS